MALRIDDIGASSKEFEIYSKQLYGFGNFLFLKYLERFKAWGRYREISPKEWSSILETLNKYNVRLTVAVTACWVEYSGNLIPFPEKFPKQAAVLKKGVDDGLIEIANHGLTHCVVEGLQFRPRWFSGNRKFHREFWGWLPRETHIEHITRSQEILGSYFKTEISTFVPPGNIFCDHTIEAARACGIKMINCQTKDAISDDLRIMSNSNVIAFHDKEIIEEGIGWLEKLIRQHSNNEFVFVKDLARV